MGEHEVQVQRNREFWCRGYYVDTVGKNTRKIKEYIAHQLEEDRAAEQLTLDLGDPFNGKKRQFARERPYMRFWAQPVVRGLTTMSEHPMKERYIPEG